MNKAIIVEILKHRARVYNKLKSIGDDLVIRGRTHDNSYTEPTEAAIYSKMLDTKDDMSKKKYKTMLDGIHMMNNDYYPKFHDNDLSKMNMIQLIIFITDSVVKLEEKALDTGTALSLEVYKEHVIRSFGTTLSPDLEGIIGETVEYIVDRNKSILKNLPKNDYKYDVETGDINGKE